MTTADQAQRTQEQVEGLLVRIFRTLIEEPTPDAMWAAVTEGLSDTNKDFWQVSSEVMIAKEFRWRYVKHFEPMPALRSDWSQALASQ
ncbi:MAG TPA: hypothetical protein VNQ73_06735 [Ilumatobacter sp.]|nr:hypothetical protein [Ilumatobacter sp.]